MHPAKNWQQSFTRIRLSHYADTDDVPLLPRHTFPCSTR